MLEQQAADRRAEDEAERPHERPGAVVATAHVRRREGGHVRASGWRADHLPERPDHDRRGQRRHGVREAGEAEADPDEELAERDHPDGRTVLRERDERQLEQDDEDAVQREQGAIGRVREPGVVHVERQRDVRLLVDERDPEGGEEEDEERPVGEDRAQAGAALLVGDADVRALREEEQRDHPVGDRGEGVAEEDEEERAVREEPRRRRAEREAEVDGEAVDAEGGDTLLLRDDVREQRLRRGAVELRRQAGEDGERDDELEAARLREPHHRRGRAEHRDGDRPSPPERIGERPAEERRRERPGAIRADRESGLGGREAVLRHVERQEDEDEAAEAVEEGSRVDEPGGSREGADVRSEGRLRHSGILPARPAAAGIVAACSVSTGARARRRWPLTLRSRSSGSSTSSSRSSATRRRALRSTWR